MALIFISITWVVKYPMRLSAILTFMPEMKGFIVSDFQSHFPEGINQLGQWVKAGKLGFTETIVHGFDKLPTALLGLFKGKNTGKMIVEA